jgi:hypothetical protein
MFRGFLATAMLLTLPVSSRADAFDRYTNPVLAQVPGAEGVREVKQLTPSLLAADDGVLPDTAGALVVVKTNEGRFAKLLVQAGKQKVGGEAVPVLIVERFVTYKDGEERAAQAEGRNVFLFGGFHLHLDVGQVVPPALGGDLRLVVEGAKTYVEPVGQARLYLLTRPLPVAAAKKAAAPTPGAPFEASFFNGTYQLHDDGRRSGVLTLRVAENGDVGGEYFSDKDGRKYDVAGKVGSPRYTVQFTIRFPRTEQVFQGWLFTGDGKALTGFSRMQDRETGFYAMRREEE